MTFLLALVALLGAAGCSNAAHDLADSFPFSSVLSADSSGNPLYTLYWNFSTVEQTITFAVSVRTNGWVGLGISPTGGMINSDVVIGWVNENGEVFLDDRYAFEQSRPPVDAQQDWNLISGENENGVTTLQFWRKWVTCDELDQDIGLNTARVVYSWNDDDPLNDDPESPMYHGANRGTASLNLLGGLVNAPPEPPADMVGSFNITVDNVSIPSSDTTYWCAAFELPQEVLSEQKYIIRYSPVISPNEFPYVHHLLVYICDSLDESDVGTSAPCDGAVSSSVAQCLAGELIAAWAVGGSDFIYPENVAYPIGGSDTHRYVVMQVHYDNPMMRSDVQDSSGIRFVYENAPRENDAGILLLGHEVNRLMIVPPMAPNYGITSVCSDQCTSRYLPDGGIKIFANLLHTHLVGRSLTFKILRRTQQCGGLEEMKPIDQNLQYDFNFQQFTYLPEEVTVYPGDILILECNYTTADTDGVVLGGESTREEMCFTFPVYYPRAPLSTCVSQPQLGAFVPFADQYIPSTSDRAAILQAFDRSTSAFEDALNQYVDWSSQAAADLEDSIKSGPLSPRCRTNAGQAFTAPDEMLPRVQCPYNAPDVCGTDGVASVTASVFSVILMITLTIFLL